MFSEKMEQALNQQVNAELYSAYLYLAMAAYFHAMNLNGFANWMMVQNQEETAHAMKFYHFINERGGRVKLAQIDQPTSAWSSPLDVFEATLRHEEKVTGLINNLVDLAMAERDHASNAFLQWFITEQVEEEASANEIIQNLKLAGNDPHSLFMLDRELATRVFTPPAA
ncbi:MAG: ferritin [Deltaproteobacteria bacterium]|nr:ferritin [Deltaproteobacteria bacterium]